MHRRMRLAADRSPGSGGHKINVGISDSLGIVGPLRPMDCLWFRRSSMDIVKMESGEPPAGAVDKAVGILERGGVVCLPCNGTYRLFADVTNKDAVLRLLQSKRRVKKAPSLVFIDSISRLHLVADDVDPVALALTKEIWPAPLTIRFPASRKLPRTVAKELTRATGKIGVRIPEHPLAHRVAEAAEVPLLVSSANRGRKSGETSPAQIRQNFLGRIDYFLDAGDLNPVPSSTVIDVDKNGIDVVRSGAVPEETIEAAADGVG